MRVDVAFTAPTELPGARTCLVIDVLRATSVMAVLLGRGVQAIYPAGSIEEGRDRLAELAPGLGRETIVLCGEEDALPPSGYDYGNSPGEFERIALPAIVSTTNGTPALLACAQAPLVMPAAPMNASAVLRYAAPAGRDILVVCSGLRGAYAEDDTIAAGFFVERLAAAGYVPGAEARQALELYEAAGGDVVQALRATEHGGRLIDLGFDGDIALCASVDRHDVAGSLRMENGCAVIRPLS